MPNKPLVKPTPTIDIDYDKYGHCVKCHKDMLTQKVVTGEDGRLTIEDMFTADQTTSQVLLDDGSKATIMLCKSCKESLVDSDYPKIMKCIIKGWEMEINEMVEQDKFKLWDEKRKKDHMKRYGKRKIIGGIERQPADVVDKMYKKYIASKKPVRKKVGTNN